MSRTLNNDEIKTYVENRAILHEQLSELQADFEDLDDETLVDCREVMLERINKCLNAILETDKDNLNEEPTHCTNHINDLKQSIDDLVAIELKQKIEVIYEVSSDFDKFVQNVISILERVKNNQCIKDYSYFIDNHVHDSYGRESQHVSFTWLDNNDKLHMTGMCLSNL